MPEVVELYNGDERGTGASHSVEQAHHLRHGGHFDLFCRQCTDNGSDQQSAEYPFIVSEWLTIRTLVQKDGTKDGEAHTRRSGEVAVAGSRGIRQHLQARDESDRCQQVDDRQDMRFHDMYFSPVAPG